MFARKLGRFVGLVFVLAAILGGVAATTVGAPTIKMIQLESGWS